MANLSKQIEQVIRTQTGLIEKVEKAIKTLPAGSLYCNKKKSSMYYYYSTYAEGIRSQTYIGSENGKRAHLISDLKRKRLLIECKKVLDGNVEALKACLTKYEEFDPTQISGRLAASYDNICEVADSLDTSNWKHAPYPRAEMHEESLKHEAIGGLMVRSKSEALIAFALDLAHVPFHYEELLELDNKKIAPDFTILHPITGERIYWEHFGMMDDAAYASETFKKFITYGQNGITPGKNLIFTMETNADPLSIREVQGMITHYLL